MPIFIRCAADLFTDEDLAEIQTTLLENPAAGDLINVADDLSRAQLKALAEVMQEILKNE